MPKLYYIAYGSNLNIRQMQNRCPDSRIIGTSVLNNWRLLFKGSRTGSYLTIEQSDGFTVPVAVWEVSKEDEKRLDQYEGFPSFYYKKEMTITVKGTRTGKEIEKKVFVYIMQKDRPFGVPTDFYVRTCLEGYEDFGFDAALLIEAYTHSKEAVG